MGLLDPTLLRNLKGLTGLLAETPIGKYVRGKDQGVSVEGLKRGLLSIPVFENTPEANQTAYEAAMNIGGGPLTMLGMIKAKTPHGMAKELAKRLADARVPAVVDKSKSTKSAYLRISTGPGDYDYPVSLRFSDHPSDMGYDPFVRHGAAPWKPDEVTYAADVFPNGGHAPERAEDAIRKIIESRDWKADPPALYTDQKLFLRTTK